MYFFQNVKPQKGGHGKSIIPGEEDNPADCLRSDFIPFVNSKIVKISSKCAGWGYYHISIAMHGQITRSQHP